MATYLVTGGCGFIGSHLVDALVASGHTVRVVDDLSTGVRERLPTAVELMVGDLRVPSVVARATHGVEGCFHLAAVASVPRCNSDWLGTHQTNQSAMVALLEAAKRVAHPFPLVYASSAAVYGDNPDLPLTEAAAARPRSPYGADKRGCELHAIAAAHAFGLATIGLRFFNVYGPRQSPDDAYAGVISLFAARLHERQPVTVFGDGLQTRDFVFVADVVAALVGAMHRLEQRRSSAAEVLNVCTGTGTTVLGLAETLMYCSGVRVPVLHAPPRQGDIRLSVGSPDAAAGLLGFRAATPLERGLRTTLAFLKEPHDGLADPKRVAVDHGRGACEDFGLSRRDGLREP